MSDGISVLSTHEIRQTLLRHLAGPQTRIVIVTPFLQDVDMGSARTVRTFVEQQRRSGTSIELFTTPPAITQSPEFRRKYGLLETFALLGAEITLNHKLHAKAFCFNNADTLMFTIMGSANLTSKGMYDHLELAMLSGRESVYHSVMARVRIYMRDTDAMAFAVWKQRHALELKPLLRATP